MKKSFKIAIPKPCHENWQTMTPNEKGRFCGSCSKTVVDFTQMDPSEIQYYLINNKRVCGHIKQSQLNNINLRIPSEVFQKRMPYRRFFSLVLLVVMGSSIMSCTGQNGKTQKIDSVEIIDSTYRKIDTSFVKKNNTTTSELITEEITIEGEMILGDIIITENTEPFTYSTVEQAPEFLNTPKTFTRDEKRKYFSRKINEFVKKK